MTFNDLQFKGRTFNKQAIADFPNGYGASVVIGPYTYGGESGLYELAVLHAQTICYASPLTEDVMGHLTSDDVTNALQQIEALPRNDNCTHRRVERSIHNAE